MIAENSVLLRYNVSRWTKDYQIIKPMLTDAIDRYGVPQTMADQYWLFIEFNTKEAKDKFLTEMPADQKSYLANDLEQDFVNKWVK